MGKCIQVVLLVGCATLFSFDRPAAPPREPFVLVELFTSEGCSSCPLADELLDEMTGILRKEGKQVVGLAFHVTYWDRLGWKDPYSDSLFTVRQKKYVEMLQVPRPYTPQAVINGQSEFVGSNPFQFRELVTAVCEQEQAFSVSGKVTRRDGILQVDFRSSRSSGPISMYAALVEKSIQHFVPRGENKSRTLKHYNVVRSLVSADLSEHGQLMLRWPEGMKPENSEVVLFAQHKKNLRVMAGTRLSIE